MDLQKIRPGTTAIFIAGVVVLAVGTYTSNGGFQVAGGLFLLIGLLLGFNQARGGDDGKS